MIPLVRILVLTTGLVPFASPNVAAAPPDEKPLSLPAAPDRYCELKLPSNFEERWIKALDTTPADNPTTDAGATLGRVLFYDTRLSSSGSVSCGTCHIQQHAFAEPRRVSIGHEGRKGDRNAMSLVNLRFSRAGFFWDERAETLEEAVGLPVRSRIEMAGRDGPATAKAIAADSRYAPLFRAAFGSETVTEEKIRMALAQFIRSMVSADSKYDRGAAKVASVREDFPNFSAEENRGKVLFVQHCNLCHHIGEGKHVAFFDMFRSLNNGLDADATAADGGRGDITLNPTEVGQFRASSLRNVAVTAPYMHDGRFETLEEVMEHYNSGVKRHPNVGGVARLGLNEKDTAALIAFLKTLTDETFLNDPRFSDPWKTTAKDAVASSVRFEGKRVAVKSVSAEERLARGEGLKTGEALPWLRSLDKNGDGTLDKAELEPLIAVLVKTRVGVLSAGRAPRGDGPAGRGTRAGSTDESPIADVNGDGKVDEAEARFFGSFKRLVELGDGAPLRRAVRTDRFLGGFDLSVERAEAARDVLNKARERHARTAHTLDLELLAQFEKAAGADAVARFQSLVIDRQVASVRRRTTREDDPRPLVERQVAAFDANGDGAFSPDELKALAAALDRLAGGFGQAAPEGIDMAQFTRRFQSYDPEGKGSVAVAKLPERLADFAARGDRNRDGILSPAEVESYIRSTAFGNLLSEGIYIGGGFTNTLRRHADAIAELDLPADKRKAVEALFADHARQLDTKLSQFTTDLYGQFRKALGNTLPAAARR